MGLRVTDQENYLLLHLLIIIGYNPSCSFVNLPMIPQRIKMHLPSETLKSVILTIWILRYQKDCRKIFKFIAYNCHYSLC